MQRLIPFEKLGRFRHDRVQAGDTAKACLGFRQQRLAFFGGGLGGVAGEFGHVVLLAVGPGWPVAMA